MKKCIADKRGSFCLVLSIVLLIGGCAAGTPYIPGPMAYAVVKPGSILKLNKEVTIVPPEAGVRFQNGKLADKKYNQWHPNCRLEVRDPVSSNLVIEPDEFTITQVTYEYQLVQSNPVLMAAVGISLGGGASSATAEVMTTNFLLQSPKQPAITRLKCQYWENPEDSRHLMLNEIEQAVGEYFTFQLKPNS